MGACSSYEYAQREKAISEGINLTGKLASIILVKITIITFKVSVWESNVSFRAIVSCCMADTDIQYIMQPTLIWLVPNYGTRWKASIWSRAVFHITFHSSEAFNFEEVTSMVKIPWIWAFPVNLRENLSRGYCFLSGIPKFLVAAETYLFPVIPAVQYCPTVVYLLC